MNVESETVIELANQLGLAVEHVFEIFVSAQLTSGIITGILLVGTIITLVLLYKYLYKVTKDNSDQWGTIILWMTGACCVFCIIDYVIYNILICIFLPEYSAALELMDLLVK